MGYLNNASVTVDAILTTKGRELLSKGTTNGLDISYFALGDDEVNYDLWNPAHPLGSDYYGIVIENMPVLEASPIPDQNLKSKLITIANRDTAQLATITALPSTITDFKLQRTSNGGVAIINGASGVPVNIGLSSNGLDAGTANNDTLGYTVFFPSKYLRITPEGTGTTFVNTQAVGDSTSLSSILVKGNKFTVYPVISNISTDYPGVNTVGLNIIIQANEIGGSVSIPVTVSFV
jgi:hypothetical protein